MTMKKGSFAWYDLMTSDTAAAETFYRNVIGWDVQNAGTPEYPYWRLSMGGINVGGLMPIPAAACENGMQPCWRGYILVDDVDACANRIKAAGGHIYREPQDIPGVLRFAAVGDPHGAAFIIFRGEGEAPPAELGLNAPGNIGWRELHAGDGVSAFAFYADLFGWTKDRAMDMGEMGVYQLFATDGSEPVGAMMTKTPDTPAPFWLFYFNVEAIDSAVARTLEGGGKLLMGPHEVPGGMWVAQCLDPQGAMFAMVAPKR